MPSRATDVFADGQVQIVEFEIPGPTRRRRPPAPQAHPDDSRVLALIREAR
jgi:hypothetical protein